MIIEFGGHSVGVIPGLVSIPEVKSLRVWFVYYGFRSMGISFCCQLFLLLLLFIYYSLSYRFGGHSVGVIPGLVSIPEVKSLRVWFVYYGFRSMGISFCCQPFFYQKLFSFIIFELFYLFDFFFEFFIL